MKHLNAFFLTFMMIPGFLFAQTENTDKNFIVHEKLHFSKEDTGLTLDMFLPEKTESAVPCIIVIQGGGFRPQDGQRFRPWAERIANHGMAAALISYRGKPEYQYPITIGDTKAAVRFVRKNAEKYNIDPGKIGATGRSAGGTLTALLAVTGGETKFEGNGGHQEYSSDIQAAVAFAGVFDFVARFTDSAQFALQPNIGTKILSNAEWIGVPFNKNSEKWKEASAINYVDKTDPPILFLHSKDDFVVPWIQSQIMYYKMAEAGIPAAIHVYETGGHGVYSEDTKDCYDKMLDFFDKHLNQ
jgi:acetyl esterase/lipase